MDNATGLLYVGNGQYYDPEIGRFLTRNPNANGNPYLPFDPTGALFVPLAFLSLVYGKNKKKSKLDVLIIITLLSLSAGVGLAACKVDNPTGQPINFTATQPQGSPTATIIASTPTTTIVTTVTPPAPLEVIATPCPTPTPTATPGPALLLLSLYGVELQNSSDNIGGIWNERLISNAWRAVTDIAERLGGAQRFRERFNTYYQNLVLKKMISYIEYFSDGSQITHYDGAIQKALTWLRLQILNIMLRIR